MAQVLEFSELNGLDLVSHDKIASPLRCRTCKNVQKRRSRALARRQGYKATCTNAGNNGGFGTAIYNRRSPTTGVVTKEKLSIGSKLFKQVSYTFTLTYSPVSGVGSGLDSSKKRKAATAAGLPATTVPLADTLVDAADRGVLSGEYTSAPDAGVGSGTGVCEILVDIVTETWHFKLYNNGAVVLDFDMGIGYDELTVLTVNELITAIATTTNFTATTTGGGTLPAAFLPYTAAIQVGNTLNIMFCESVVINQPTGAGDPFAGEFANRNGSQFENVSTIQIHDIILFGSKWDSQKKYDGSDVYRSGAPTSVLTSVVEAATGALANGAYQYMSTIVQIDAQGNEIEGIESVIKSVTTVAGKGVTVTVGNVLNTTGFNTDCAIVNGAQSAVNIITVDNGSGGNHTMKVGQTAYFLDGVSGAYVQRLITAKATTTITVAGAAVTVADNAVISNNLRIRIYRSVASGTILKENVEIPNNSFAATQAYLDAKADTALGADFVSPSLDGVEHGLPPTCGYLGIYDGGVVAAGDLSAPDTYYFTSPDGPEYYPSNFKDNSEAGDNLAITGVSSGDRFFWIQKREVSFLISGKLASGQFTAARKGDSAGCLAHATIIQADTTMYWLGEGAIYESIDGGTPTIISTDIAPIFDNAGLTNERKLQFKRATAVYDRHTKFYILFIPAESSQSIEVFANQYSRVFAFDTVNRDWWEWTNLNWAGGVALDIETGDMIWTERRYSTFNSTMAFQIYQRLNTNTPADFVDHVLDIPWSYEAAGSIDAGNSTVNKKFLYVVIDAEDPEKTPNYTLTMQIEKDNIRGVYQTELSVLLGSGSGSAGGWGYESWGFFPWGNPMNAFNKPRRLRNGFARTIRTLFSGSGIYSEIVLSSFQLLVEAPYKIDINEARNN